jgi:hypothetical protein
MMKVRIPRKSGRACVRETETVQMPPVGPTNGAAELARHERVRREEVSRQRRFVQQRREVVSIEAFERSKHPLKSKVKRFFTRLASKG